MLETNTTLKAKRILSSNGLRNTENRMQILGMFLMHDEALSSQSIEDEMQTIDRITVYRTLKAFEDKGIIHQAVDGTSTTKYALCGEECDEGSHKDQHAHFHCISCGKTLCLDNVALNAIHLPPKYELHSAQLLMQGICRECKKKRSNED